MRRTRKWLYVAQEATRLAELGLAPKDIAARLGVTRSSVSRWMTKGKLKSTARAMAAPVVPGRVVMPKPSKTPQEWASDVRSSYDLDATDDQLVTIAEGALTLSMDSTAQPAVRLQAAARFQSLVKQLALVARAADAATVSAPESKPMLRVVRRATGDPRRGLVVNQ